METIFCIEINVVPEFCRIGCYLHMLAGEVALQTVISKRDVPFLGGFSSFLKHNFPPLM